MVPDRLFGRIEGLFGDMGWNVVTLKYGRRLQRRLRPRRAARRCARWIDDCPNSLYSALTFQGGAAWRQALLADLGRSAGLRAIIDPLDDASWRADDQPRRPRPRHLLEAFRQADAAGTADLLHRLHHQGHGPAVRRAQGQPFRPDDPRADGGVPRRACASGPATSGTCFEGLDLPPTRCRASSTPCPFARPLTPAAAGWQRRDRRSPRCCRRRSGGPRLHPGGLRRHPGRDRPRRGRSAALAERIVTTSPDVTVSTNLGPWVNRRGMFDRHTRNDVFRDAKLASAQRWGMSPTGQHIELGIAEQNLFLLLGAAGLQPQPARRAAAAGGHGLRPVRQPRPRCADLRLLPGRPLPAGVHPVRHHAWRRRAGSTSRQHAADRHGGRPAGHATSRPTSTSWPSCCATPSPTCRRRTARAVWLRLSTRQLHQPQRVLDPAAVIAGAHWVVPPGPGARSRWPTRGRSRRRPRPRFAELREEVPGAGLLAVTSPDRLHAGWLAAARAGGRGQRRLSPHRAAAGAAGARRGPGHDPGRAPGRACLARRGARAARGAARP